MFKKIRQKELEQECWNLDHSFILWLDKHLKQYYKDASRHVDLEYHKIKYNKVEYTLKDLIQKMIKITSYLREDDNYYYTEKTEEKMMELMDILKLTICYLWW